MRSETDSLKKLISSDFYKNNIDTTSVNKYEIESRYNSKYASDKELFLNKKLKDIENNNSDFEKEFIKKHKLNKNAFEHNEIFKDNGTYSLMTDKERDEYFFNRVNADAEKTKYMESSQFLIDRYNSYKTKTQQKVLESLDNPFILNSNYKVEGNTEGYWNPSKNLMALQNNPSLGTLTEELAHKTKIDDTGDFRKHTINNLTDVGNSSAVAEYDYDFLKYMALPYERQAKKYSTRRWLADKGFPIDKEIGSNALDTLNKYKDQLPHNVNHYYEIYMKDNPKDINKFKHGGLKKYQEGGEIDFYSPTSTPEVYDSTFYGEPELEIEEEEIDLSQIIPSVFQSKLEEVDVTPNLLPNSVTEKGSIAVTHFNPGNIKFGNFAKKYGAEPGRAGTDGGQFANFKSYSTGLQAQKDLITGSSYRDLTVDKAMKRWSNNGYGGEIYKEIQNKTINSLSETELNELLNRQIQREDVNLYKILKNNNLLWN